LQPLLKRSDVLTTTEGSHTIEISGETGDIVREKDQENSLKIFSKKLENFCWIKKDVYLCRPVKRETSSGK